MYWQCILRAKLFSNAMDLLILKTNITSKRKAASVQTMLDSHPVIRHWSIDTEDMDNVLRIELRELIDEGQVARLLSPKGFYCEDLDKDVQF